MVQPHRPSKHRYAREIRLFLKRLFVEFARDQCLTRASSLAFASLLALVPLSALLFSLFSALGTFSELLEQIRTFLFRQLLPTRQEEVMLYIRRFVTNTRALGAVGLLFFLITAVLVMNTIQNNFNAVWGSPSRKNSLNRLTTYASILIVGSFLISMGLNLSGMLRPLLIAPAVEEISRSFSFLLGVFPTLFIFLALLLMILFIPEDRIRLSSALIGAAAGALLWEIARKIFSFWVTYVIRLSVVYGSLAAIPIFLIWLYVAWAIVLFSLEITYVLQYRPKERRIGPAPELSPADRLLLGLDIYLFIAGRFYRGETPPTREEIAAGLRIPVHDVRFFTELFRQRRLLIAAGRDGAALVPSRSLESVGLKDIWECLFAGPSSPSASGRSEESMDLFERISGAARGSVEGMTLLGYMESRRPGRAETAGKREHLRSALPAGMPGRAAMIKKLKPIARLWNRLFPSRS